ncbi:MAG TPA: cupin domain-containing protein [Candidatus Thermoplasmatota archaeon]|nr:cupin domain-containing protein [Candidatus Thermoplasmatota archaeon]
MPAASADEVLWTPLSSARGAFFRVLHQTRRSQTAVMTVAPGEEAGPPETHEADQIFHVVEGEALVRIWADGRERTPLERRAPPGTLFVVPAGVQHWVKSVGREPLFFLTVYAPPEY